jgi:CRISPR-associated protein Csb2
MATAIALKFPAGRYHATTWGRHVNEGAVEWPPSPWRILRTIVAAWKVRMEANDELLASIIKNLAGPPEFYLPPATIGHTRHYMPLYKGERTLVFDTFAAVDRDDELHIVWRDAELTSNEKNALGTALGRLTYLGRAESWCDARLVEGHSTPINCYPEGRRIAGDAEVIRVLTAIPDAVIAGKTPEQWPLCANTLDLRSQRWSDPPGSRWVSYCRPLDCFAGGAPRTVQISQRKFTVARFALYSRVRPLVMETISIGEFARRELQRRYGFLHGGAASPVLSGKESDGTPRSDHGHAFFLPTDEDNDGRIDHLTVVANSGFSEQDLRALDEFSELRQVGKSRPEIKPVLIALGKAEDFRDHYLFRKSMKWRSVTPYVPTRHTKKRGGEWVDTPADQVCRELGRRGIGVGVRVAEHIERDHRESRWIEYRLERLLGSGLRGQLYGSGFKIEFTEPVAGPISLGYGCHFGLGQFAAE